MYLKALTLHGFKSFADATTLHFEPGVTAVVGPNGCGKSNIADAIRWVLGEQSAKALRGGKMQDVIFEGTDTRKPAQLCEASLLLADCEKQLGSDFHEIEIMRRVHRDGQGEYFFNGQLCRLKDIQKLFMDTGVGRTSYSIMAQGQIDLILSSKPEERRTVFEEAAGITKYKSQRREAMNKLALTEQNLVRATDVITEVARQIGSLKRQAAKALRYRRLNHRLRHLALAWSHYRHTQLSQVLAGLEARVAELRAEADARRAKLDDGQQQLEALKAKRSRHNQAVQEAQQSVYDLRSQQEGAENRANLAETRRKGLEERVAAARDNVTELEMQLREVSAQADTGAQDKQLQLGLLGSSDAAFQQRNRELAITEGELTRLEREVQQAKFELLQAESAVSRLRTDGSAHEVEQKTSALRHEALALELTGVRQQREEAEREQSAQTTRHGEAQNARTRAQEAAAAAQQEITVRTGEFREAQRKLQELDRALAQRTARLKLLQQLQESLEGFGEGAKALLQGRLADVLGEGAPQPVMAGLAVKPEYGAAVEALLGSAAEAIVLGDWRTVAAVLARLESGKLGRAVLQVGVPKTERNAPAAPDFLQNATVALGEGAPGHPAAALLASCYVTDDLGAFLAFWQEHPDFEFMAVANRKGELVDRRGLVYGGYQGDKPKTGGIVQREIDRQETAKALAQEQAAHDRQKTAIEGIGARLQAAEQSLKHRQSEVLAATQALAGAQAEQRNAERRLEEVMRREERMVRELAEVEKARDEAQARWQKARTQLTEAEAAVGARREAGQKQEARRDEVRAERDAKRETLAQARLALAEHRQKVEVLDRGLDEMERRREQLQLLLAQRQQETEEWAAQIETLSDEARSAREQAGRIGETLGVAQQRVQTVRQELVGLESAITAGENALSAVRGESDGAQGELNTHEVRLAENRQRMLFLAEEVQREFQEEVAAVDWRLLLWRAEDEPEGLQVLDLDEDEGASSAEPADGEAAALQPAPKRRRKSKEPRGEPTPEDLTALAGTNWDEVKATVDALRQRLGSMGSVNLVAIEEYAELKQRHDFLQGQCDDLTKARAELLQAIDEINQTSLRQFETTFEQVRKNFIHTFQTLFGGGKAELELVAGEDVLESGIEIVAQPPGTKLKNINLLSGGQKTLTAVALLFALYMVKPSPFCLLDELDAPLDESNIGRFVELLRKFVAESQFIIITHNKRTVSAAQTIYGVTMEERGVSKTVSMRFNREREEAEVETRNLAEAVSGAGR